jgi:endonuclease-3
MNEGFYSAGIITIYKHKERLQMDAKEKAGIVYDRLMEHWGMPDWNTLPAIDELVNTIISQNTNDRNRDVAFAKLKENYPTWDEVRDAPVEDVIQCIRNAGLANQKAPRIQKVLRAISAVAPDYDLSFLKEKSPEEAKKWLTSFEGVGLKTASIVMVFSLGMPAFPVDTHIYRVSGRLGLRPEKMDVNQTHELMLELFDPSLYGPAHINLILLGRRLCDARKPKCEECFLNDICDFVNV